MLRYVVFMSRRVNLNASKCAEMLQNEYDMGDVKEVPVGEGFPTQRTDIVCLIMAGAGGFEPPYGGIKIRCLTTWLRPIARASSSYPESF